jgi:predicted PurR-regulated permease PerM
LIGIKFGLVIGIASGLLNLLPYVGQGAGFAVAMIVAFVNFDGWGRVLAVPLLFGAVQFLESTVITPKVVGNRVGLSPVWALMALIVGGDVGGFLGLLTAIPITGCLRIVLLDLLDVYRTSDFYTEPPRGRSSLEES